MSVSFWHKEVYSGRLFVSFLFCFCGGRGRCFVFIKLSKASPAHTCTGQSGKCTKWMAVPNIWAGFPCLQCSLTLMLQQEAKWHVFSLACLPSDIGPVITDVEKMWKEVLFLLIIANEQVLSYCISLLFWVFFFNCNYSVLKFMFSLFIFWHYLSDYHEIAN